MGLTQLYIKKIFIGKSDAKLGIETLMDKHHSFIHSANIYWVL